MKKLAVGLISRLSLDAVEIPRSIMLKALASVDPDREKQVREQKLTPDELGRILGEYVPEGYYLGTNYEAWRQYGVWLKPRDDE